MRMDGFASVFVRRVRHAVSAESACFTRPTKILSHRLPREPPGAPGGLEVVSADEAVEIENFADEVKAGMATALERVRIDFVKRDAAARDLGLREAQGPRHAKR